MESWKEAARFLAREALVDGDSDGVRALARAMAERDHEDPWACYFHGRALGEQGRWPEALAALERCTRLLEQVLAIDPHEADPWVALAEARLETGDPGGALEAIDRAFTHTPGDARAYLIWGRALYHAGDLEGAIEAFRGVQALDPDGWEADSYLEELDAPRFETRERFWRTRERHARARVADGDGDGAGDGDDVEFMDFYPFDGDPEFPDEETYFVDLPAREAGDEEGEEEGDEWGGDAGWV